MTDAETRLEAAWSGLASPARDALFRIRLMEAMERRILRRRLAWALAGGAAAAAALAIAAPHVPPVGQDVMDQLRQMLELLAVGFALAGAAWMVRQMRVLGVRL